MRAARPPPVVPWSHVEEPAHPEEAADPAERSAHSHERDDKPGEEGPVVGNAEIHTRIRLAQHQVVGEADHRGSEGGGEDATEDSFEDEWPAHEPVAGSH